MQFKGINLAELAVAGGLAAASFGTFFSLQRKYTPDPEKEALRIQLEQITNEVEKLRGEGNVVKFDEEEGTYTIEPPRIQTFYKGSGAPFSKADWTPLTLQSVAQVTHNVKNYKFTLPEGVKNADLPVASCISTRLFNEDGEEVSKPYTPVSTEQEGVVEFLIKTYENGKMTQLLDKLEAGATVEFKGPWDKVAIGPNMKKSISLIAGGSGITPMLQVAERLLNDPEDETSINMVFANVSEEDIMAKERIDELAKNERFSVKYVIDRLNKGGFYEVTLDDGRSIKPHSSLVSSAGAGAIISTGGRARVLDGKQIKGGQVTGVRPSTYAEVMDAGYISQALLESVLPDASERDADGQPTSLVLVCGPPGMMGHICGKKPKWNVQGDVEGLLKELGFSSDQVFKF